MLGFLKKKMFFFARTLKKIVEINTCKHAEEQEKYYELSRIQT